MTNVAQLMTPALNLSLPQPPTNKTIKKVSEGGIANLTSLRYHRHKVQTHGHVFIALPTITSNPNCPLPCLLPVTLPGINKALIKFYVFKVMQLRLNKFPQYTPAKINLQISFPQLERRCPMEIAMAVLGSVYLLGYKNTVEFIQRPLNLERDLPVRSHLYDSCSKFGLTIIFHTANWINDPNSASHLYHLLRKYFHF